MLCKDYDAALIDLDGVVYISENAVDYAVESLTSAVGTGLRCAFVTNNAGRSAPLVATHLRSFGLDVHDADVMTSAMAAADLLATHVEVGLAVAVVGGPGVTWALVAAGFRPVAPNDPTAVAVLMGYGPQISWQDLAHACVAIRAGALFVATNTDRTFPTSEGLAPGNGVFVQAVEEATSITALVAGKPSPVIFRSAAQRLNAQRALVIGDRLNTDIAGANNAGFDSLLVLSGVTSAREVVLAIPAERPTMIENDLRCLAENAHPIQAIQPVDHVWDWAGWRARVVGAQVVVEAVDPSAQPIGSVQVAAAAAWASQRVVDVIGLAL